MSTLAEIIRSARKARGLTHVQLAKLVGVSRTRVSQWEKNGDELPAVTRIPKLASALDVNESLLAIARAEMVYAKALHEASKATATAEAKVKAAATELAQTRAHYGL